MIKPTETSHDRELPRRRTIWRWVTLLVIVLALALPATADAQRKKRKKRKGKRDSTAQVDNRKGAKVFDFTGMQLGGRMRTPQLMYFLDRAKAELDRAALEKRSFIPEMARSMEEERL